MQTRRYVLSLLFALVVGLPGCEEPYCDTRYLDVEGIEFAAYSEATNPIAPNATVRFNELRLHLDLKTRGYGAARLYGGFIAVADCKPPDYPERVDSLIITSQYDYDAQHPAGTSLNDLMGLATRQMPSEPFRPYEVDGQRLSLWQRPAASGPQQFRVRYYQTNGEIYVAETVVLTLLR